MRRMKLSDIKIKDSFINTIPSEEKMKECRKNWNEWHHQDRYIVVDYNNVLIDGYIMYLVLKENGIEEVEVKISHCRRKRWYRKKVVDLKIPNYRNEETTYVYGVHPNSNYTKEFVWRVPKSWTWFAENVQVGDMILCGTKFGCSPVIVTKVEVLDKCPVEFVVKGVVCKEIRRNGMVVRT